MEELQDLLAKCEIASSINFDHHNNRVQCYAHIINICSSHIITSFTSTSKSYLSILKVPSNSDYIAHADLDSNDESSRSDTNNEDYELELPHCYDGQGNPTFRTWFEGIERDPLRHA